MVLIPPATKSEFVRAEHAVVCREHARETLSVVLADERFIARHSTIRGSAQMTHSIVIGIKSLK